MKKRTVVIASIVAAIIILGLFFLLVILPRLIIYNSTKLLTIVDNPPAAFFTEYDVKPEFSTITVDNGKFSVSVPDNYILKNEEATSFLVYIEPETENIISLLEGTDTSINLLDDSYYDDMKDVPANMKVEKIKQGFEKLGHGLPDSAYNTYKCAHLLTRDDYSFWDLEKAVAFSVIGIIKEISFLYDETYLYETEDICGILNISRQFDETANITRQLIFFNFYSSDNLNVEYTLLISSDSATEASLEKAYAVINSINML